MFAQPVLKTMLGQPFGRIEANTLRRSQATGASGTIRGKVLSEGL